MAKWVEKGSLQGPPGEIPDVSDFLRDGDVSSAISGSSDKVASDKAVKDYVDSVNSALDGKISAEATSREEQDEVLLGQISGKANVEHSHEINDVTGLRDELDGKSAIIHTHVSSDVTDLQGKLDAKSDTGHTHDAADVVSGTLAVDRVPSIPDSKIEGVSASKLVGTIPTGNLPSYVDDVIEADDYDSLPPTGEDGKIYVDKETNKTYRWGGSAYVEISASLALGETSATAFRGDYGQTAYQHAQSKGSEFASGLYKIATNSEGHVTGAVAVQKSDITALGIPGEDTDTTYEDATTSDSGLMSAADKTKLDGIQAGADKLPEGGTDGQVLTKTADGVAWEDAASVDTSKLVNYNNSTKNLEKYLGGRIDCISIPSTVNNERMVTIGTEDSTAKISVMESNASGVQISADIDTAKIVIDGTGNSFQIGDKSVTGITDDASDGSEWSLATAKAVADYVAENAGSGLPEGGSTRDVLVKTASGEEWSGGYVWVDSENSDYTLRGYFADGERNIPILNITSNGIGSSIKLNGTSGITVANNSTATIEVKSETFGEYARLTTSADNYAEIATNGRLTIGSKSVSSITDDASTGDTNALATAKAVKDYVDAHGMPSVIPVSQGGTGVTSEDALVQKIFKSASTPKASATQYGVVKFASDADFKAYMGIS